MTNLTDLGWFSFLVNLVAKSKLPIFIDDDKLSNIKFGKLFVYET